MTLKRAILLFSITAFCLLFIGLASVLSIYLFLPGYVESKAIPSALEDSGIEVSSLNIRYIGLNSAEIGDVVIGSKKGKELSIDSIRLDYSISELLGRRIEKVVIGGISINADYRDKKISIGGLDNLLKEQKGGSIEKSSDSELPEIGSILVKNSILNLEINGVRRSIPFDLFADSFDRNLLPGQLRVNVYPFGNSVIFESKRNRNGKFNISLSTEDLSMSQVEYFLKEAHKIDVNGMANADLTATLSLEPFSLSNISALLKLKKVHISSRGILLKNPSPPEENEQPCSIRINSKDTRQWSYEISTLSFLHDTLQANCSLKGKADITEENIKATMKVFTSLITGEDSSVLEWDIEADNNSSRKSLNFRIEGNEGEKNRPEAFKYLYGDDIDVRVLSPHINLSLEFREGLFSGSYIFKFKNITAEKNKMSFSLPMVSLEGSMEQQENAADEYFFPFLFESKEIKYKEPGTAVSIPDYQLKGKIKYSMEKGPVSDALFTFENGTGSVKDGSVKVSGISGKIPFNWPFKETEDQGEIHVKELKHENYSMGPADLKIFRKGQDISLTGTVKYPELPDMTVNLTGFASLDSSPNEAKFNFEIPAYEPARPVEMGRFSPELKGFNFKGRLKTRAELKLSNSVLETGMNLNIAGGMITNREKKLSLDNISLNLTLEDIISPRSLFGQELTVGKASLGKIEMSDFLVNFRIDSLSSLFLEHGSFKWAGGNINIQSFRVDAEKDEYRITLFCDRIRLADLLEQFGVSEVSGEGTVNGKIPLVISNGKVSFNDGFLYSTPGGGGKINIRDTTVFKTGMTPGTPEYVQMDIAGEALKAFDYSWVKMSINTDKNELKVKLQFDGKPEKNLPFRYDKDLNRFIRVEADMQGANFQGIRLDVNLSLPLDELLNYRGALDMIN